jgi:hypothetical protein
LLGLKLDTRVAAAHDGAPDPEPTIPSASHQRVMEDGSTNGYGIDCGRELEGSRIRLNSAADLTTGRERGEALGDDLSKYPVAGTSRSHTARLVSSLHSEKVDVQERHA